MTEADASSCSMDMTTEASLSLADSYQVDENYTDAIDVYAAALATVRDSQVDLHVRALSHRSAAFYQLGRYEEAMEDANQALELILHKKPSGLRPGEGEMCHKRSGLAAFKLQQFTPAKEALEKAAQLASLNNRPDVSYLEWIRQCDEGLHPQKDPKIEESPSVDTKPAAKTASVSKPATTMAPKYAAAPAPVATAARPAIPTATSTAASRPVMPKYQFWQNNKFMTISILEANVQDSDLDVTFSTNRLVVKLLKGSTNFTVIANYLYSKIDPEKSKIQIKDEKVLLKLRKADDGFEWNELFGKATDDKEDTDDKDDDKKSKPVVPVDVSTQEVPKVKDPTRRPYTSHRDWDAIEKNIEAQEKQEKPQGDEAMNALFQQIYAGASEETKRAMVKSYQTSGGTVLSTNWDEVGKTDYEKERTAPKGMEWKNWEGDKLPMKKEDE
jgi:hypothetical protein